jgi:pimeloyl-ACP methyl ester carboxylesterase
MNLPRNPRLALLGLTWLLPLLTACAAAPSSVAPPRVREELVTFTNGDVALSGTLMLPAAASPVAGIVLFHGSGPEPRNLEMARWFAEQGIAALTYDKRGVGESTGDFRTVPFMDLHLDGLAGVAFLKRRRDIDASRVGVWGLSQGGWLGPLAAARSTDVAFVIAVSGPGVSPGEQMVFYYANQLRADGVPEADVQAMTVLRRHVWQAVHDGHDLAVVRSRIERARATTADVHVKAQLDDLSQTATHAGNLWITQEINYDPVIALRRLKVPILFLFGEDDRLVPVDDSVRIIRDTLTTTRHPDFTIRTFPGADHTMHVADPDGSRRRDAEYLSAMRDWLRSRVNRRSRTT